MEIAQLQDDPDLKANRGETPIMTRRQVLLSSPRDMVHVIFTSQLSV